MNYYVAYLKETYSVARSKQTALETARELVELSPNKQFGVYDIAPEKLANAIDVIEHRLGYAFKSGRTYYWRNASGKLFVLNADGSLSKTR